MVNQTDVLLFTIFIIFSFGCQALTARISPMSKRLCFSSDDSGEEEDVLQYEGEDFAP